MRSLLKYSNSGSMLTLALYIAAVGWVYAEVLTKPDHILGWWKKLLTWWLVDESDPYQPNESFLYKPLVGCYVCVTGQIALWTGNHKRMDVFGEVVPLICLSILFAIIIHHTIQLIKHYE